MRVSTKGSLALVALIALVASVGCQRATRIRTIVMGPIADSPSPDAFARLQQAARGAGYEPIEPNLSLGVFQVETRHRERDASFRLIVQSYASGHFSITPSSPRVRQRGAELVVPTPVRDEMIALSRALVYGTGLRAGPPPPPPPPRAPARPPPARGGAAR